MMRFELYRARRGLLRRTQWRWRLKAGNGQVIATSGEGYNNRGDALAIIEKIMTDASTARIGSET